MKKTKAKSLAGVCTSILNKKGKDIEYITLCSFSMQ